MRMDPFEQARTRVFSVAYRMLGSRAEAEDVVQETYLRWHNADRDAVRTPRAWLITTATRLAIDRLRALKTEREAYNGPWLPEPLMSVQPPPPDRNLELSDDVSIALLVTLERLAPEERAAFLLHDVFDVAYAEIASALDKTESSCRQMVHRARNRVRADRKRFSATPTTRAHLLERFVEAVHARDEKTLLTLFAPDATWTADSGGKTAAGPQPVVGAERIVKLLLGLQKRFARDGVTIHVGTVNGEAGLIVRSIGRISSVMAFATDGEQIQRVYAVLNPDKLPAVTNSPSGSSSN
jgi:RNA polymerase sigma-70 factor (ECF subfamily)